MGPEYFGLKSDPNIKEIEIGVLGNWFYSIEKGIFLQKWKSTKHAESDLLFIEFKTLNVITLKSNIYSVNWKTETIENRLAIKFYGSDIEPYFI